MRLICVEGTDKAIQTWGKNEPELYVFARYVGTCAGHGKAWLQVLGNSNVLFLFTSLRHYQRLRQRLPVWKKLLAAIDIGACSVIFAGAASELSLLFNDIADERFACIAFVLLWLFALTVVTWRCIGRICLC